MRGLKPAAIKTIRNEPPSEYLSIREAAIWFSIAVRQLKLAIESKSLPAARIGRTTVLRKTNVAAWVRSLEGAS